MNEQEAEEESKEEVKVEVGFIGLEDDFVFKGPKKKDNATVWKGFDMN